MDAMLLVAIALVLAGGIVAVTGHVRHVEEPDGSLPEWGALGLAMFIVGLVMIVVWGLVLAGDAHGAATLVGATAPPGGV